MQLIVQKIVEELVDYIYEVPKVEEPIADAGGTANDFGDIVGEVQPNTPERKKAGLSQEDWIQRVTNKKCFWILYSSMVRQRIYDMYH